jgi:hypothetical protein
MAPQFGSSRPTIATSRIVLRVQDVAAAEQSWEVLERSALRGLAIDFVDS